MYSFWLDNILIYSVKAEDCTRYIGAVFEWLAKSNFYFKYKKKNVFCIYWKWNSLDMWFVSIECQCCYERYLPCRIGLFYL